MEAMLMLRSLRLTVVGLATVHAYGLVRDRPLVAWSGTLTMAALLAYAWLGLSRPVRWNAARAGSGRSWPDRALLVGLAALTAAAWLVDARSGGYGWPLAASLTTGGLAGGVAAGLLLCAAIGVAGAVVATVGRPRSRWWLIGTAGAAVTVAAVATVPVWINLTVNRTRWLPVPDPTQMVVAVLPFAVAAVLAVVAAGTVAAAGMRMTGAVLVPLAGLALLAGSQAAASARLHAEAAIPVQRSGVFLQPGLRYGRDDLPTNVIIAVQATRVGPGLSAGSAGTPSPPRDGPQDFWTAEFSWAQAMPGLAAMLFLVGLVAAVNVLLPVEAQDEPVQGRFYE
jgi:hypothetical protein